MIAWAIRALGLRHAWRFMVGEEMIEVPVRYPLRIDHGLALREAALAGAGIILQPHALVSEDIAAGRLQRLLSDYEARGGNSIWSMRAIARHRQAACFRRFCA
jgi:DNA-binding transcriptional LysR family regulator